MCADHSALPVIFGNDDDDDEFSGQIVKGVRVKFNDKIWSAADGTPLGENDQFLVVGTGHAYQRWVDGRPEVITERPLPDLEELNDKVPREQWPIGKFSQQPEPPWKRVWYIYLVRVRDGLVATHINSTAGVRVAYSRLKERIKTMGALQGPVLPIVKLAWAMMPSSFGPRPRPDFIVESWRGFGGNQPAQIESPKQAEQIGKPVKEPTLAEEMNDEIGF
jgi:hypothetical protein